MRRQSGRCFDAGHIVSIEPSAQSDALESGYICLGSFGRQVPAAHES